MNVTFEENIKWIPFGILTLLLVVSTGYWKIEKSREAPLKPVDQISAEDMPKSAMEGEPAPAFTLPLLGGGNISLADSNGKLVFLNIWATWCLPCREEMPSMQRLYELMGGDKFEMIAISIDKGITEVEEFVKEFGLTFPIAFDPKQTVADQYKITGVPETYLISPDGVVMHHIIGPGEWDNPGIVSALSRAAGLKKAPAGVAEKSESSTYQ
ncbi:hypothetical protein MNBD_NITROSPINAE03-1796 [hydrothermal vent metagenome]|uniref:Thioredoxin domain-containing protein n=1 Tax=hydrothermal vent metagenome TaxID=652676 RepID=A0A3B1C5K9_9ZZZZ